MRLEWVGEVGEGAPAPFARARLANGVRVLVRESRALPIVAVDCWVRVGALEEADAHAGVSHFLEHMFFKGTARHPVGAMDRIVKGMGGYNNAATSMEYTHYYIVAPADGFARALDLLADHLTGLALPADELERERQVVKEEIRRKDDAPQGRLYTALARAAYGSESPYAREILGSPETLDAIDRDVMEAWWRGRYVGQRLVVAVAGDVEAGAVLQAVEARLGGLSAGDAPEGAPVPPEAPPAALEDAMDVTQSYLAWGFPTAGRGDLAEACAIEVGAAVLGEGETSRLYRRLVEEARLVTAVGAWTYGLERTGLLGVDAVCAPARRERVEGEVADVLAAAVEHGVSEAEVARARATLLADFAYDNETSAAITGTLGEFETLHGDAGAWREIVDGIRAVTPDDVAGALRRRVDPARAARAAVGP